MISIKPDSGVSIKNLTPQMAVGIMIVRDVYLAHGHDCVITSVCDGDHMDESKHYEGNAADFRIKNIDNNKEVALIVEEIRKKLGESDSEFDVVLESDHIHVEYDPE